VDVPVVVFASIDRVLDDRDLSFGGAASAVETLAREQVPLVLCSTKTRAQLEHACQDLNLRHPFICERGSAVFIPTGYFGFVVPRAREMAGYHAVEFGRSYAGVVETLHRTAGRLGIEVRGFSDMSVEEVARECNLSLLQARLAKLREYAELFRILDPGLAVRERLVRALYGARVRCITSDRYHHIGADVDAGVGIRLLRSLYRRACGPVMTVGVAEAAGDLSLLECVEDPIIVKGDDRRLLPRALPREACAARMTTASGAAGWLEVVADIVRRRRGHATTTEQSLGAFEEDRG
jgi:mannosyl-3-phosphoglycerate phosphatase